MTERIDHAAEAKRLLGEQWSDKLQAQAWDDVVRALVHSQLALVEQQRIANEIALRQAKFELDSGGNISLRNDSGTVARLGKALGVGL